MTNAQWQKWPERIGTQFHDQAKLRQEFQGHQAKEIRAGMHVCLTFNLPNTIS